MCIRDRRDQHETKWNLNLAFEEIKTGRSNDVRKWLQIDGIKGNWALNLREAEALGIEVDPVHRDIGFAIERLVGTNATEDQIWDYLFKQHGVLPSDELKLDQLLKVILSSVSHLRQDKEEDPAVELKAILTRFYFELEGSESERLNAIAPTISDSKYKTFASAKSAGQKL